MSSPDTSAVLRDALVGRSRSADDAAICLALVHELAAGDPVPAEALAAATGRSAAGIASFLSGRPNVQRDHAGRVVGFGGLSIRPTSHHFEIAGRTLYTWCAWDTLFLPAILGETAGVRSVCPASGAAVRLSVGPNAILDVSPPDVVLSFPVPASICDDDIAASFCCHVHFLAGGDAANRWAETHAETVILTLEEAFELGRLAIQDCC